MVDRRSAVKAGDLLTLKEEPGTNSDEDCAAHFIRLSVEPDGRSYTVWVPPTGHRQTYTTR